MGHDRQQYIHNVARTLQGRIEIWPTRFEHYEYAEDLAKKIQEQHFLPLYQTVNQWTDETLGKVAACGLSITHHDKGTTLYQVIEGDTRRYGGAGSGGRGLLLSIAITAIIAAMTDNIRADQGKAAKGERVRKYADIPHADAYDDVR